MAASFAGARNLDERRRRRLATAAEDQAVTPARRVPSETPEYGDENSNRKVASVALFPVRKLISPRVWKHAFTGMFLFAVAALILTAGLHLESRPEQFGPGFAKLFEFETGRAVSYFSGGLMTLAGQIAFLIWWARSRSLHDYNGTYRVWAWASTFGVIFGFCLLTDAHVAFSLTVFWMWNVAFWKQDVLCWLAPTLVITGGLFWPLRHDMFECKGSRSLFSLAAGCWVIVAAMELGFDFPVVKNQQAAHAAVGMIGALSFFLSMLMHARFVLYETAEAPVVVQKPSLLRKVTGNVAMNFGGLTGRLGEIRANWTAARLEKAQAKKEKAEQRKAEKELAAKEKADAKLAKAEQLKADKAKAAAEKEAQAKAAKEKAAEEKAARAKAAEEKAAAAAARNNSEWEAEEEGESEPKKKPRFRLKSEAPTGSDGGSNSNSHWEAVDDSDDSDYDNDADDDYSSDDEDMQHLSRKERKKLKKMQRQQTRRAS
ncbi:MAG: hypothetical protein CL608_12090 [Anaerolineaceae bacterium]|nr:hypothetical protein [Anaerolineaceae bacterium]